MKKLLLLKGTIMKVKRHTTEWENQLQNVYLSKSLYLEYIIIDSYNSIVLDEGVKIVYEVFQHTNNFHILHFKLLTQYPQRGGIISILNIGGNPKNLRYKRFCDFPKTWRVSCWNWLFLPSWSWHSDVLTHQLLAVTRHAFIMAQRKEGSIRSIK